MTLGFYYCRASQTLRRIRFSSPTAHNQRNFHSGPRLSFQLYCATAFCIFLTYRSTGLTFCIPSATLPTARNRTTLDRLQTCRDQILPRGGPTSGRYVAGPGASPVFSVVIKARGCQNSPDIRIVSGGTANTAAYQTSRVSGQSGCEGHRVMTVAPPAACPSHNFCVYRWYYLTRHIILPALAIHQQYA